MKSVQCRPERGINHSSLDILRLIQTQKTKTLIEVKFDVKFEQFVEFDANMLCYQTPKKGQKVYKLQKNVTYAID